MVSADCKQAECGCRASRAGGLFLQGTSSAWHPFLRSLPQQTETPILWSPSEQKTLLRGSPVAEEASSRAAALDTEWNSIESLAAASPGLYPAGEQESRTGHCIS